LAGIDLSKPFHPLHVAILTVSDSRTEADDRSGATLAARAAEAGHVVVARRIVPDRRDSIVEQLRAWADDPGVEVILTTGGTGVTERDVTPEAIEEVCDKLVPGFGELFRQISYELIGTSTLQSRALAGVVRGTYVFALPGSTGACRDGWDHILKFQLDIRHRPCNFAELLPRLRGDRSPRYEPPTADEVDRATARWLAALSEGVDATLELYDLDQLDVIGPSGELATTGDALRALLAGFVPCAAPRLEVRAGGLQPGGLLVRSVGTLTLDETQVLTVATSWHRRSGQLRIGSQSLVRHAPVGAPSPV
jgi:molybdenum cofactor biosynthesis protein B